MGGGLSRFGDRALLRIARVRILLTNDDGISAQGLQSLRRALLTIPGAEVSVIAPDSNRSATARSITTRSPLSVEEVDFGDGSSGFATDGTPVDCVRFADLGLVGERPDLIVSGINHGATRGDDITYSGTVAAALEGIILGIPAIAVSQQSKRGEMDFRAGDDYDFSIAASFAAELVRLLDTQRIAEGTLINVNCPAKEPTGVEVTHLGKRLYNDELKLVSDDDGSGRRRYQIYGFEPSHRDEEGSDLTAIAAGRIAVTPVHFDLTDHSGFDPLRGWNLDGLLESALGSAVAGEG